MYSFTGNMKCTHLQYPHFSVSMYCFWHLWSGSPVCVCGCLCVYCMYVRVCCVAISCRVFIRRPPASNNKCKCTPRMGTPVCILYMYVVITSGDPYRWGAFDVCAAMTHFPPLTLGEAMISRPSVCLSLSHGAHRGLSLSLCPPPPPSTPFSNRLEFYLYLCGFLTQFHDALYLVANGQISGSLNKPFYSSRLYLMTE